MRHFEEFEIEHLLNSTGSWLLRQCCRVHLEKCELCRQRRERILEENFLGKRVREAVRCFEKFSPSQSESEK